MNTASGAADQGGRLAVFRNRNFTLLWVGSIISNSGGWMQMVAQGYLVYQLSGSPFLLGAIGVSRAIPFIVLAPFGGVVADRVERLKLLKITNVMQFSLALLQAMLVVLIATTLAGVYPARLAAGFRPADEISTE